MKKIQDNESIKPYLEMRKILKIGCAAFDRIPFIYKLNPKFKITRDQIINLIKESEILTLPDQFNHFFSKDGWICYGDLSEEVIKIAVNLSSDNKHDEAKNILINYIDADKIEFILKKCRTRDHFKERLDLLNLLKIDYLEQRYHACLPLLLALIDGLVNDVSKHVGFFAEKSDVELYDSITCHESGLPFLKLILNTSRTKTTTEKIHIPFRNGILHGRDLNFANKEVASKCWWVLDCLIEWADEKSLNKKASEQKSLKEILDNHQKTQEYSKRIDKWKKRPIYSEEFWKSQSFESLKQDSPEYTLYSFLNAWKAEQWGKMTPLLLHTINQHVGKSNSEVKKDFKNSKLESFRFIESTDQTPSTTEVLTEIKILKANQYKIFVIKISLNYIDPSNRYPELRGESNGKWFIRQANLSKILY